MLWIRTNEDKTTTTTTKPMFSSSNKSKKKQSTFFSNTGSNIYRPVGNELNHCVIVHFVGVVVDVVLNANLWQKGKNQNSNSKNNSMQKKIKKKEAKTHNYDTWISVECTLYTERKVNIF